MDFNHSIYRKNAQSLSLEWKNLQGSDDSLHTSEWVNGEGIDFTISESKESDKFIAIHLDTLHSVCVAALLFGLVDFKEVKKQVKNIRDKQLQTEIDRSFLTMHDLSNFEKWHLRFLEMAKLVSTWSKDISTKVGSVIVDKDRRVVSTGFNGYPQGIKDDLDEIANNRQLKYKRTIHSEINSILFSRRDLTDCTIYIYPFLSCADCAKVIIQSGIKTVVTLPPNKESEAFQRWKEDFEIAEDMYKQSDVEVIYTNL